MLLNNKKVQNFISIGGSHTKKYIRRQSSVIGNDIGIYFQYDALNDTK